MLVFRHEVEIASLKSLSPRASSAPEPHILVMALPRKYEDPRFNLTHLEQLSILLPDIEVSHAIHNPCTHI
jgi:hypothetical protein